tara:strand:+ start:9050 stop:9439 length:390 start_codon:yes stop_codon:yes gene_type:complete
VSTWEWGKGLFRLGAGVFVIAVSLEVAAWFAIAFLGWKAPDIICEFMNACESPKAGPTVEGPDGGKCSVWEGEMICLDREDSESSPNSMPPATTDVSTDTRPTAIKTEPKLRKRCGNFDGEIICIEEET